MSTTLQFRRGNTAVINTVVGAQGELFVNTDNYALVVHNGLTVGGFPLAQQSNLQLAWNAANTSIQNSGGTIIGTLNITGNSSNLTVLQTPNSSDITNTYKHSTYAAMFSSNTDNNFQVGIQNFANTQNSSSVFTVYNNLGSDNNNFINMGLLSSSYNVISNQFTAARAGDGFLFANSANLIVGTDTPNKSLNLMIGGYSSNNIAAIITAQNTVSTSTNTGTIQVRGGVGVTGVIYASNIFSNNLPVLTSEPIGTIAAANTIYIQNNLNTANANIAYTLGIDILQNTWITGNSIYSQASFGQANSAAANTIYIQNNLNTANANIAYILGVNILQNTWITGNSIYSQASFGQANSAAANTIYIQNNLNTANANIAYILGVDIQQNTWINANNVYNQGVDAQQNTWISSNVAYFQGIENTQNTWINANNSYFQGLSNMQNTWMTANSIYSQASFGQANSAAANTIYIQNNLNTANANIAYILGVDILQNTWISSNVAYFQGIENTQNTWINANNVYNQGVDAQQNTWISANNAYFQGIENTQNTSINNLITFSQSSYNTANVGYNFVTGGGTVSGNVGINGNLTVTGNVTYTGNVTTVSVTGNTGQFFGNTSTGFGALYSGIPLGFTIEPQTVNQITGNYNGYIQINQQNINSGNNSSGDFVVTADNGTTNDTYINMGINSSTYNQIGYTLTGPNDGYLYVSGNNVTGGGNLLLGTATNKDIVFSTGGLDTIDEVMRITSSNNVIIKSNIASTNTTSGTLRVIGGVGITGNVYATQLYVGNNTPSTSNTTGSIISNGGIGITGNVNATGSLSVFSGMYSTGSYVGPYSDGVVVDYVNGNGRISVGIADNFTFYNGGVGNTPIANISSTGAFSAYTLSGIGSGITNLYSNNLFGTIPGTVLANSTIYIGTTPIPLNSGSGSIPSLSANISGSAPAGILTGNALNTNIVNSNLSSVGTITSGIWNSSLGVVSAANLTNVFANNLFGTIPNNVLGNSTIYIGSTSVNLNRPSGSLALTGISTMDGIAANANNSLYNMVSSSNSGLYYPSLFPSTSGNLLSYANTALSFNVSSGVLNTTGLNVYGQIYTTSTYNPINWSNSASLILNGQNGGSISLINSGGISDGFTITSGPSSRLTFAYGTNGNTANQISYITNTGVLVANTFYGSGIGLSNIPNSSLSNSQITINGTTVSLGGSGSITAGTATIVDDNASPIAHYPVLAMANTGSLSYANTSSLYLTYIPSTGNLIANTFSGSGYGLTGTAPNLSIGGTSNNVTGVVQQSNGGTGATSCGVCRAWVNFGYVGSAVIMRSSFNVSSISRVGAGIYQLNFTTPMPSANGYCVSGSSTVSGYSGVNATGVIAEYLSGVTTYGLKSNTQLQVIITDNNNDAAYDPFSANIVIFG